MLAVAFDRPAIRTAFQLENCATDFIGAVSLLQQAVATGVLKDGTGYVIDHVRCPQKIPAEITAIKATLQKIRDIATYALAGKTIVEHATVIEIKDPKLCGELNELRRHAVEKLNTLLVASNIEPVKTQF